MPDPGRAAPHSLYGNATISGRCCGTRRVAFVHARAVHQFTDGRVAVAHDGVARGPIPSFVQRPAINPQESP